MTELLITLMNAPKAIQRAIALAILAAFTVSGIGCAFFLASFLSDKEARIEDMRSELFRFNEIIARRPRAETAPLEATAEMAHLFLEGGTAPMIQAKLQERVNAVASASGAIVSSISGSPPIELDGAAYVGVRVDFEGSLRSFHEVLRQLETTEPPLIIRQASIRSTNMVSQGQLMEPLQLAGQIMIYGATDPAIQLSDGRRQ